jgi:hypothetical protein
MIRLFSFVPALTALVLSGSLFGGCIISSDVTDFEIKLPDKSFHFDTAQVSPLAFDVNPNCVVSPEDSCAAVSDGQLFCNAVGDCEIEDPTVLPNISCSIDTDCTDVFGAESGFSCNQTDGACQATVEFELSTPVNLANEVPELEDLGNSQFTKVRFSYVRMFVQENTFSIATPPVEIYIAPEAVASPFVSGSDPRELENGVFSVGVVDPIAASTSGHTVDVQLDAGGDAALSEYCRTPSVTFKFFVYSQMTFRAGDPVPQGALTLVIDAAAIVGLN